MRTLNLALQGGGSHGAFTWGVLDALMADGRIDLEGVSGASAGAVNAVSLASGWCTAQAARRDPREGARECLRRVWTEVARWGALGAWQQQWVRALWGGFSREFAHTNIGVTGLSPYQANPLDLNPLRDLLSREIDFEAIARHPHIKVYVSATQVHTGKAAVFGGARLTCDAVMASTCLPTLFHAVEIDGQPYWDGGYSVNPALTPLIRHCETPDIMLVQIDPVRREHVPRSRQDILDRVSEITFNASLLTQLRSIDLINRLRADGTLGPERCKSVLVHRIDGGEATAPYPASSRSSTNAQQISELFDIGQAAARQWLAQHYWAIGQRATVDIATDYLDDTRIELPPAASRLGPITFRQWIARLMRRSR